MTSSSAVDDQIWRKFLDLPQPVDRVMVTYVWIDGSGELVVSKTQTLKFEPKQVDEVPWWYTLMYESDMPEVSALLKPVAIFRDPFYRGNNKLVLCETYTYDRKPHHTNKRASCANAMQASAHVQPWFGIEQDYCILDKDSRWPLGWSNKPQGYPKHNDDASYCVGADRCFGRRIVDAHYKACLYAGVELCGISGENMPAQWQFQVGPLDGVTCADHVWMARYLLHRVAEEFGVLVTFDPKPVEGWAGSGSHHNFSTKEMREEGGIEHIKIAIEKLAKRHALHMRNYDPRGGADNKRRLTGKHQTSDLEAFSAGVADWKSSINIPRKVDEEKMGYLEDRRPAANCDPYLVTDLIVRTTILNETGN